MGEGSDAETLSSARRPSLLLPLALLLAAALYLAFPARVYRGDGMAYAEELRRPGPGLVNPNHLLYGVTGYGAFRLARLVARHPSPIRVLQYMGVATALVCLTLFDSLLRSLGCDRGLSVGFTLCLAFSSGFWLQAISPETFLLSMALEALFFRVAVRYLEAPSRSTSLLLGCACGLAVLGTEVDLLLAGPMAWVIWREGSPRRAGRLCAAWSAAVVTTGIGFCLAARYAGIPVSGIFAWLLGRAAAPGFIGFDVGNLLRDLRHMVVNVYPGLSSLLETLAGELTPRSAAYACAVLVSMAALLSLIARAIRGVAALLGRDRVVFAALGAYLAGLTIFFTVWANHLGEFWANHLLPMWALIAMTSSADARGRRATARSAGVVAASLAVLGLSHLALPLNGSDEGRLAAELGRRVGPGDLLVVTWNEALPVLPSGVLQLADGGPVARSTFAVNLETYLDRPVQPIGCWTQATRVTCHQGIGEEELAASVLEGAASGRKAWLLQVSATLPREGLPSPELFDRLARRFGLRTEASLRTSGVLAGATLYRLEAASPGPAGAPVRR